MSTSPPVSCQLEGCELTPVSLCVLVCCISAEFEWQTIETCRLFEASLQPGEGSRHFKQVVSGLWPETACEYVFVLEAGGDKSARQLGSMTASATWGKNREPIAVNHLTKPRQDSVQTSGRQVARLGRLAG